MSLKDLLPFKSLPKCPECGRAMMKIKDQFYCGYCDAYWTPVDGVN